MDDDSTVYVMPKNLLRKFVQISDSRSQIGGFIYGKSPDPNSPVIEIQKIVMVPQLGNTHSIQFPNESPSINDIELLGWIHTQSTDYKALTPVDINTISKFERNYPFWSKDKVTLTVAFTPGSVTLSSYTLNEEGYEWGKSNKDLLSMSPPGYSSAFSVKNQLVLSDRIVGSFMVPDDNIWNFAFLGQLWSAKNEFDLKVDIPLPYYHEFHRPIHFSQFNEIEANPLEADQEDNFE
ncbi:PROCT-domain-containing protein [Yamadazyma tenuis ATCC 10573]|uniref:PROCT-domain-containing protein n=2 Tax=Candida tenuis TaxID=2315449 RepID=G3AYA3_CANTC|nr:PROCT-domain-containing protein [Yamadazyma tenuis ATCC 10573]EGV65801.1 PROCT-domain-containing protein [Yamadazyma tenuis ATCC 10573]